MKHYIFGDLHSSGIELNHLIKHVIKVKSEDQLILVGDQFDRGIHGHIVWNLIQEYNIKSVLGNHEKKWLDFMLGKRNWLPQHYYWAMNDLYDHGVGPEKLTKYFQSLPLMIKVDNNIIVHAGVDVNNPYQESESWNVYGNLKEPMPQPKDSDKGYWWDKYLDDPVVIYGHLVCENNIPRIRHSLSGKVNSIGIDTATCHGGPCTAVCLETQEIFQYCSGIDYYTPLKKQLKNTPIQPYPQILEWIKKNELPKSKLNS